MVDINDKLFWMGQRWPADAYGYVFLGRALTRLGKTLFPSEWTGNEMVTEWPYPRDVFYVDGGEATAPKPLFWMNPRLLYDLERVLCENHPDIHIQHEPGPSKRPLLTESQYVLALQTIERVNPQRVAALSRVAKVTSVLSAALRDDVLKFALLPEHGGEFLTNTKAFWWNVPAAAHRWMRCQMSPTEPYSKGFAGAGFMHIFVWGQDLDSLLRTSSRPTKTVTTAPIIQPRNIETHEAAAALLPTCAIPSALDTPRGTGAQLTATQKQIQIVLADIAAMGGIPPKAMDRNKAIRDKFEGRGWTAPSVKTIERYLAKAGKNSDI